VENYLGEEAFRQGVHNYLAAHLYGNATAEDFWGAQTAASHKPVDKIMGSLVAQPGEPILSFGQPANGKVSVAQKRFYLSPSIQPDADQKWTLPVCFKSSNGQECDVLTPAETSLPIPSGKLFFANANGKGYYRSNYSPSDYAALLANVETALSPVERISLLGDEWAQVRANKASVGAYLNLVAAMKTDSNAAVIESATDGLSSIFSRIVSTPEEKAALSAWVRRTFAPQYAKLAPASETDSASTRELRADLFTLLAVYGKDPEVIAQALPLAQRYLADPASVDATLGIAAISVAASHGDSAFFDQLQKVSETSTVPEIQIGSLRRLADFEDPALVERALDYAISGKVRNQDTASQLSRAIENDQNRAQAWKYIQSHWDQVQANLTPLLGAKFARSLSSFCSVEDRNNIKRFFDAHRISAADQALKHSIESIDGCIEFRSLQEPKLQQWLAEQPRP
jgi:aminopeptidase N/puromycin-sensitive aminopeptidase